MDDNKLYKLALLVVLALVLIQIYVCLTEKPKIIQSKYENLQTNFETMPAASLYTENKFTHSQNVDAELSPASQFNLLQEPTQSTSMMLNNDNDNDNDNLQCGNITNQSYNEPTGVASSLSSSYSDFSNNE